MAQQLGRYEILESLGIGATAEVFRARDTVLGREVALKVLKPALVSDPTAFARFAQEAQAAAQLFHPHIALVLDMGSASDRYFIALQYVPGKPLDKVLAEDGPLTWAEVLRLAEHIGEALTFAHARGFLHRDVKPANIIRTPEGEYVLTDFGLTRAMMATGLTTHTGAALGTPAYIPPEIWRGKPATPATDEYALACVLVEALTGKMLFSGDTPPAVMTRHVLDAVELPATWPPDVPEGLETVFAQSLAKTPEERHGGPGSLLEALQTTKHKTKSTPQTKHPPLNNEMVLKLAPGVDMVFVRIPASEFLMGSDPEIDEYALEDELPQHKVYLDAYWMAKYPVTAAQYLAVVKAIGRHKLEAIFEGYEKQSRVHKMRWNEATEFCEWTSQVVGREVRLPTEAEWEKAARGTDGRVFPWGNETPDASRYNNDISPLNPHYSPLVGEHSPHGDSPYGCADMLSTTWEWSADWYDADYYRKKRTGRSPQGPANGEAHVLRGGRVHYDNGEWLARCASRGNDGLDKFALLTSIDLDFVRQAHVIKNMFPDRDDEEIAASIAHGVAMIFYRFCGFRCMIPFLPGE